MTWDMVVPVVVVLIVALTRVRRMILVAIFKHPLTGTEIEISVGESRAAKAPN